MSGRPASSLTPPEPETSHQVILNAGPRQRGVSDHDCAAGGDGVRHRRPEAAAVWPDRQKPGEQKPPQTAAQEVRERTMKVSLYKPWFLHQRCFRDFVESVHLFCSFMWIKLLI